MSKREAGETNGADAKLSRRTFAKTSVAAGTAAVALPNTLLGSTPDWESLWQFLPEAMLEGLVARSAIASTFTASLELAREGKIKLRQSGPFGPIYLKAAEQDDDGNHGDTMASPDE